MLERTMDEQGSWRATKTLIEGLRSPRWGIYGQGLRFALAGGGVMAVYLATTTLLHTAFGVSFQIALAIGYACAVVGHFTLQRLFVWRQPRTRFVLSAHRQAIRYLLLAFVQYGLTALSTSQLPGLVDQHVEVVYLTTVVVLTGVNFLVFRTRIFHVSGDKP
jgi:putative flippase GtrA